MIAAAFLHDTIEDTKTTREELVLAFGSDVADLVVEVTDDKSLPDVERKRLQVEHAPGLSVRPPPVTHVKRQRIAQREASKTKRDPFVGR